MMEQARADARARDGAASRPAGRASDRAGVWGGAPVRMERRIREVLAEIERRKRG